MAEFNSVKAAVAAAAVTPSDTTVLDCRALYVGVTGNIVVTMPRGNDVTFSNVPVGFFPVQCAKVKAATTASSIVALY